MIRYNPFVPMYREYMKLMVGSGMLPRPARLDHAYFRRVLGSAHRVMSGSGMGKEAALELELMHWEGVNLFCGVEIRVDDRALVEALLRSDIDALASDVHLPFPVCEFVFPCGIPLLGDYQVSGAILANYNMLDPLDYWEKHGSPRALVPIGKRDYDFFFESTLMTCAGNADSSRYLRFRRGDALSDLRDRTPVEFLNPDETEAGTAVCRLCIALCLYLQTKEGQKAVEATSCRPRVQGVSAAEMRTRKQRKSYMVRNLIPDKHYRSADAPAGTEGGGSRRAHWRRLHMRSLRHDKYKRNEDGSVRVVWVKPALVSADSEHVKQVRKVNWKVN